MNNPLVSIILCCHNRADILPTTLESIFAQKYQPVEIIVVDDGSTDTTPSLMKHYEGKVRYYWHENQGVTKTRTIACKLAKGEYIAFIDDDDLMPDDRIVTLFNALQEYPQAVFSTGDFEVIDETGNLTGKRWLPGSNLSEPVLMENGHEAVLWPKVAATVHTTLFRKADGEKIGWFDEKFRYASEDKDFFARLGLLRPIVYVPKVVSYYRRGHESLTSCNSNVAYEELLLYSEHINSIKPENKEFMRQIQQRIFTTLRKISSEQNQRLKLPKQETKSRIKKSLGILPLHMKLKYFWIRGVKHPIKRLLVSTSGDAE